MTADLLRAKTPVGAEINITFMVDPTGRTTTRTQTIYATVVDHGGEHLIVGVHPNLYAIPFAAVVDVVR